MAYAILMASGLLFELGLNVALGALPLALAGEGASTAAVAVAMGTGMFASVLGSFPAGVLADRFGRLATIRAAAWLGAAAMAALGFVHGVLPSAVLMGLRSVAIVAFMTAEFAYASQLASKARAVSSVATLGMIGNLCFATGPVLGVLLYQHGFGRAPMWFGSVAAAAGALLLYALPAQHDVRARNVRRTPIVMHPRWLPATAFTFACCLQGGVNGSLAVLTFTHRGIVNGAAIFSAIACMAFLLRYPSGRLVDRFGPRALALPTALVQALGCVLAATAWHLGAVIVAGACLGAAWAAVVPVALGLLFEHSSTRTRGAAMGAYNFAFGGGAAAGALIATATSLLGGGYAFAIALCALGPLAAVPYVMSSTGRGGMRARSLAGSGAR